MPPALFLPISREKWGPPPGRRGPRGAALQGQLRSRPPEGYAGAGCPRQVVRFGPSQVRTCGVVPRPVPGGGSRLSLRESPDAKSRGGGPPPPHFLWPARFHSLALAVGSAAGRWRVYFVAHLRALIWIRILREQGLGEKAFRCGGVPPTKASPWGEAVTEGDG